MWPFWKSMLAICVASLALVASDARAGQAPLCAAIRAQPQAAVGEALEALPLDGPEWNGRVPNVDIDGDGRNDAILLFRGDSPSRFPGDSARARIELSATGKAFPAEFPHIAILRFRSQIYLVGVTYSDAEPSARKDIHLLDKRGMTRVCSLTVPAR